MFLLQKLPLLKGFIGLSVILFSLKSSAEESTPNSNCTENIPPGAERPSVVEYFPERATAGFVTELILEVKHGKGETILPEKLQTKDDTDHIQIIEKSGFIVPDPVGGTKPTVTVETTDTNAITKLHIPFVPLPKTMGRQQLMLPAVPISISRASGDVVTICTKPHVVQVEDPIANTSDPKVKNNPPTRVQREEWTLAKQVITGLFFGTILGAILFWAIRKWSHRPTAAPPPPPKLPWVEALEELAAIKQSDLIATGKNDVYFDRVSDTVRKYLGARYGFDGLESTTHEIRSRLRAIHPPVPGLKAIGEFLSDCDLVKFANVFPAENDCIEALQRGEAVVHMTMPTGPIVREAML